MRLPEDALAVQGIDADAFGAEQFGKDAARREADLVPLGEDHFQIGVELAVRQPRRAMIEAPRQLADFRMQRAAISDIHLLKTAADAE
jgi:hypothetical protein